CFFFFFSSRRRHTRFDCDWSSDVCSSDLRTRSAAGFCFQRVCWKCFPKDLVFCARRVSIICPARRIFTYRRRKFGGSICRRATRSEERRVGKEGGGRRGGEHGKKNN